MNLCDLKTIKGIMKTFGLEFKKEFGQNFLTNKMVVETIADECCLYESKTILEIGPGIGTLTRELCERYPQVISYEIDKTLIPVHAFTLGEYNRHFTLRRAFYQRVQIIEILFLIAIIIRIPVDD